MKTHRLAFLVCLASCTVTHDLGTNSEQAVTCGGIAQLPCSGGYVCVDDPNDACDPSQGGADCSGLCATLNGSCGGFGGLSCPSGQSCIDDPRDGCDPKHGGADCPGVCVVYESPDAGSNQNPDAGPTYCGGLTSRPCPSGDDCVDDPSDTCDPTHGGADCSGICVPHSNSCGADPCGACAQGSSADDSCTNGTWTCRCAANCGGFANIGCPSGQTCVDRPNDSCDPNNGGADCPGICVGAPADAGTGSTFCGGLAQIACPSGLECVDDPNDGCDPAHGGADCGGICVTKPSDAGTKTYCGGFANLSCPSSNDTCVDDPSDGCDPNNGGADCPGICVSRCGGPQNVQCPSGLTCIPDNATACTTDGGPDACSGVCQ